MQGSILAYERLELHKSDTGSKNINDYYKRRLDELNSSLCYLWNVHVVLGADGYMTTYLNQFLSGPSRLNDIFIDSFFASKGHLGNNVQMEVTEKIEHMICVILQDIARKGYQKKGDSKDQVKSSLTNQIWDNVTEYYRVKSDVIPYFFKSKVSQQTERCNFSVKKKPELQGKSKSSYFCYDSYWMEERNSSGVRRSRENQSFVTELSKCEKN